MKYHCHLCGKVTAKIRDASIAKGTVPDVQAEAAGRVMKTHNANVTGAELAKRPR